MAIKQTRIKKKSDTSREPTEEEEEFLRKFYRPKSDRISVLSVFNQKVRSN